MKDKGEQSLGRRILRIAYILSNQERFKRIVRIVPTIIKVLLKEDRHTLYLPQPVELRISPSNLTALAHLWGQIPIQQIDSERDVIVWELAPGVFFKTCTHGGFDLSILWEVYIERQYGSRYEGLRVLDIGGYHGESAIYFMLQGAQSVACIEPYPPAVERLTENLKMAHLEEKVRVFPVALGGQRGTGHLAVSDKDPQSNTLEESGRSEVPALFSTRVLVPIWTLEDILNELEWQEVDVAKLDCEGCEYSVLSDSSDQVLQRVKVWIMEFHNGAERLERRLQDLGYTVEYTERFDRIGILRAWLPGASLPWKS